MSGRVAGNVRAVEFFSRLGIRRRQLLKFFDTLPSCLVGIDACGSAHHWARELTASGHNVRPMPAAHVKLMAGMAPMPLKRPLNQATERKSVL